MQFDTLPEDFQLNGNDYVHSQPLHQWATSSIQYFSFFFIIFLYLDNAHLACS